MLNGGRHWSNANEETSKNRLALQILLADIKLDVHRRVVLPSDIEQHNFDRFMFTDLSTEKQKKCA